MKCRFCGKKLKKNAAYCSQCGRGQAYDALPEGENYEEYYDEPLESDYTFYEEATDSEEYTAPAASRKKGKFPLIPVVAVVAVVAVVTALVMMISTLSGTGSSGGKDRDKDKNRGDSEETSEQTLGQYDLLWPDLRSFLGNGNYTVIMETSKLTMDTEVNNGETGYIYEIWISEAQMELLATYLELVQTYHYELDQEQNGYYYYRFVAANAPSTISGSDAEYHCMVAIVGEISGGYVIRCSWLDAFELDQSVSAEDYQNKPDNKPQQETKPQEQTEPEQVPQETEEQKPAIPVSSLTLPDHTAFFGCHHGEDQAHGETGWMISCQFDLDIGRTVVSEYLGLLQSGDYPLKLVETHKADFTNVSASVFYAYFFQYTGSEPGIEHMSETDRDTKETVYYDVKVSVYYNYRAGWILVSCYYDKDFELMDVGERASVLPINLTGRDDSELAQYDNPNWNKDVLPCTGCGGDGDCSECNGDGYLWSSAADSENRNCWKCNNSGICQTCYGSGKR